MIKKCVALFFLSIGVACLGVTLVHTVPVFYHTLLDEFRPENFTDPKPMEHYLPNGTDSARYREMLILCRRFPAGSIGIEVYVVSDLRNREANESNELRYVGFENIVRQTGNPVRFIGSPPESVTHVLTFVDLVTELGVPSPVASFEDMALYTLEATP